jgi:hypothetical protein
MLPLRYQKNDKTGFTVTVTCRPLLTEMLDEGGPARIVAGSCAPMMPTAGGQAGPDCAKAVDEQRSAACGSGLPQSH